MRNKYKDYRDKYQSMKSKIQDFQNNYKHLT